MTFLILGLLLTVLLALMLRYLFRVKGKWLAIVLIGLWAPIMTLSVLALSALARFGQSADNKLEGKENFDELASGVGFAITVAPIAVIWLLLGIAACVAAAWQSRRK